MVRNKNLLVIALRAKIARHLGRIQAIQNSNQETRE